VNHRIATVEVAMTHNKAFAFAVTAALLVAACADDTDGSGSGTLPTAPPTAATTETAPRTTPPTSSSTTSTTSTTGPPSTETTTGTLPPGIIGLSPDGPWTRVDSAPGITTPGLFYELMPKLWVYLPLEQDIENGILATFSQEDAPIIEAYLQARLTYYRATTQRPVDLADEGWARYYTDGGAAYRDQLTKHRDLDEMTDLDAGVVLRPEVLGDERSDTRAIIFDCLFDGAVWRLPDGSLGSDSTPGISTEGAAAIITFADDRWILDQISNQPDACV
jgi:hypothetical protein